MGRTPNQCPYPTPYRRNGTVPTPSLHATYRVTPFAPFSRLKSRPWDGYQELTPIATAANLQLQRPHSQRPRNTSASLYSRSNVIRSERTGSRGKNPTAKNSSRGSNPISRQNHSFPPKNVRDSSTAHTAVKGMRRHIQRALARKKLLRNTPGTRKNAPSNCALNSNILHS